MLGRQVIFRLFMHFRERACVVLFLVQAERLRKLQKVPLHVNRRLVFVFGKHAPFQGLSPVLIDLGPLSQLLQTQIFNLIEQGLLLLV